MMLKNGGERLLIPCTRLSNTIVYDSALGPGRRDGETGTGGQDIHGMTNNDTKNYRVHFGSFVLSYLWFVLCFNITRHLYLFDH